MLKAEVDRNKERKVRDRKKKEVNRVPYYYAKGNTFRKIIAIVLKNL